ncbi:uncharacterized protein LOC107269508 isoform X2 [Cephus cinctus]|nr:uncharacterized protein LOC107269508 isoform X2 [Cephus cinctus]
MFDKPNTVGFIHVSHFLLTIHNAERFKKAVQWPIVCKKTEAQYRNNVKDYLNILSNENPNIGFPAILASHLLRAGGTKFTMIMWKLSQLVLYTYLKMECQKEVLLPPKMGSAKDLTKQFFTNVIENIESEIQKYDQEFSKIKEDFSLFAKEVADDIILSQSKIFETKKILGDLVSKAPVAVPIRKRLMDLDDDEIIELWKSNILNSQCCLRKKHAVLQDLESLSRDINNMITNILSESKVLDGNSVPRVNTSIITESNLPPEVQVLSSKLYMNNKIVLSTLLSLFCSILYQLRWHLKDNRLPDLSHQQLQVHAISEDTRSMCNLFHMLLTRMGCLSSEIQVRIHQKDKILDDSLKKNMVPDAYKVLFMPSPTIDLNSKQPGKVNALKLDLSPVEGMHKALFSRHKRKDDGTLESSKLRTNLLISRINFDDTISSITSDKQSSSSLRKITSKLNVSAIRGGGKYSRLFGSVINKNSSTRAHSSMMSIPSNSKANSTALMNTIGEIENVSGLSLDMTAKSLLNLTRETTDFFSRNSNQNEIKTMSNVPKRDNVFHFDTEVDSLKSISHMKVTKPSIADGTEVELSTDIKSTMLKSESHTKTRTRRSISDLVEKYRTLVERSTIESVHFESTTNSSKDE